MVFWLSSKFKTKRCNVILSAGGPRVIAQVGALEALDQEGWVIENICGISAGSIVASFYASGYPLDKMKEMALKIDFGGFTKFNYMYPNQGLFIFDGLGDWVSKECMSVPESQRRCNLHIGACSLNTGRKRIFTNPWDRLELAKAIEATCTIPVIFKPVSYEDESLADGALWSSAPVHFYADKSSEKYNKYPNFVINVQNSHVYSYTNFNNPIKMLYRIFEVFQINRLRGLRKRVASRKYSKVCMVEPEIGNISSFNFSPSLESRRKMIQSGKSSMLEALKRGTFDG